MPIMNAAAQGAFRQVPWKREIPVSDELKRIIALPRRDWFEDNEGEVLAKQMTQLLKTKNGTMELRSTQAIALHDLAIQGGLICLGRVGIGKTLISLLCPYVCESVRPLLLIPANLRRKTERDMRMYRAHFEIGGHLAIEHYEMLARSNHAHYLDLVKPDLIICDEAHALKNTRAAVVRRLKRYLAAHPETKVAFLSGTLTNRSLKDYWHLMRWALPDQNVPMPTNFEELDLWSLALDEKVQAGQRVAPGALLTMCNEEERELAKTDALVAARRAYRRRLVETPGVVATRETFTGASLRIEPFPLNMPKVVEAAFSNLRTNWETPDGWPISDGHVAAKHAKELALGFYYRWNPRPPQEWMIAKRNWCSFVRKILSHNKRNLDTEAQVLEAVVTGIYPKDVLMEWLQVKDTFDPNVEAVWLSDFAIDAAMDWALKEKGIIWVHHRAFGERLAKKTGLSYYGEGGFDARGAFIEDHLEGMPLIASIKANKEGKNLQRWNTNLVTNPPSSGKWWEQMLGRTHRDGQEADEVHCKIFASCIEHYMAFYKSVGDAQYVQDSMGQVQKLLYADVTLPTLEEVERSDSVIWTPNKLKAPGSE